jgi:hypothetical protein
MKILLVHGLRFPVGGGKATLLAAMLPQEWQVRLVDINSDTEQPRVECASQKLRGHTFKA